MMNARASSDRGVILLIISSILFFLSGCTSPRTEIIVTVDTDLDIPGEIDALEIEVHPPSSEDEPQNSRGEITSRDSLPATLGLVHESGDLGPFLVYVRGFLQDSMVIERRASVEFVKHQTLLLPMNLSRDCVDVFCIPEQTCADGQCRPVIVLYEELDRWDGQIPRIDEGPDGDIDSQTDPDTDIGSDADHVEQCPDHCECHPTCDPGCRCIEGCPCSMTCVEGCIARCIGAGTRCEVDASGIQQLDRFVCREGAVCNLDFTEGGRITDIARCVGEGTRCRVDARGASRFDLQCTGGARCRLRCGNDPPLNRCTFSSCDGKETLCSGNIRVCNRACP